MQTVVKCIYRAGPACVAAAGTAAAVLLSLNLSLVGVWAAQPSPCVKQASAMSVTIFTLSLFFL